MAREYCAAIVLGRRCFNRTRFGAFCGIHIKSRESYESVRRSIPKAERAVIEAAKAWLGDERGDESLRLRDAVNALLAAEEALHKLEEK